MKKIIFLLAAVMGLAQTSFTQEESGAYIRKGLLRATGTISPGILLKENSSTISLHGNLEYYVDHNISLRGDAFYSITLPFQFNHAILSGASYHFKTKNHFDPYLTLEPGIAISKLTSVQNQGVQSNFSVNPLFSGAIGFNFYFEKYFHLFMEGRYIYGEHLSNADAPYSLSELRFSFGLGYNLHLLRPKN